ncbi:MAG TPA: site-2 protease family protein [Dehalococcoidia bacterium]|nr:site-2 protease family protein [Dehalococcoidia bacterium]
MGSSIKLGRIFGIDIGIHWSWIFIFLIVTWSFATGLLANTYPAWSGPQLWLAGALIGAIFFLSILLHELSHAVVSNRAGLPVRSITLFVFGGVSNLTREPDTPGMEFRIAIVGPATSLGLGVLFAGGWAALYNVNDGLAGICAYLAAINASLAVFNMLPGFPLDGGRVFRSIVWARNHNRLRATRVASRTGEWIAYGIMAVGVAYTFWFSLFSGLWFLLIGFFLRNASAASYEQLLIETTLSGIAVRDVMRTDVDRVPPDLSLEELVHDHVLKHNARCFAVMAAGDFAGLVTLSDLRKAPREQWPATSVYRAMTPATQLHTVSPGENLTTVLRMMATHDVNQLPVLQGRELVGMLDRADVLRYIQVHRDLGSVAGDGATPEPRVPTGTPGA